MTGRLPLLRRITGRRASQNVVSTEHTSRPGTLILTAHYDAARGGAAFGRPDERRAALGHLLQRPIGPFEPFVWSLLLLLASTAARLAGLDATALSAVQFVPTVVLIVSLPFLADIAAVGRRARAPTTTPPASPPSCGWPSATAARSTTSTCGCCSPARRSRAHSGCRPGSSATGPSSTR